MRQTHTYNHPQALSNEETERYLRPYFGDLEECFNIAWDDADVSLRSTSAYSKLSDSTRAAIMHDCLRAAARSIFDGRKNVVIQERSRLFLMTFDELITLRFKKLDRHSRPSISHTAQQTSFIYNLALDGIRPSTYVTAGYILNDLKTGFQNLQFIRQQGKEIIWVLTLQGKPATQVPSEIIVPLPEITASAPVRRVISKKAKQEEQAQKEREAQNNEKAE